MLWRKNIKTITFCLLSWPHNNILPELGAFDQIENQRRYHRPRRLGVINYDTEDLALNALET